MMRLNLSSNNARSCEEINTFVKEYKKLIKCQKKIILNQANKPDFDIKNPKSLISLDK